MLLFLDLLCIYNQATSPSFLGGNSLFKREYFIVALFCVFSTETLAQDQNCTFPRQSDVRFFLACHFPTRFLKTVFLKCYHTIYLCCKYLYKVKNMAFDAMFHFVIQGILEATESPLLNLEPFKIYKDLVAQCKCLELMSLILCQSPQADICSHQIGLNYMNKRVRSKDQKNSDCAVREI